ncbi:MAG: ribosomal protein S18-alanine N-acetyltransferase [Gemmatimonadota bacterium]
MAVAYQIRPARLADVSELADLEPRCFTDPWSAQGFREMLGYPHVVALVAELKSRRIAGYLIARAIEDEGEILNIAVAPENRRHGIGLGLLETALRDLSGRGVESVFLEVRASNQPAVDLYVRLGFRPVGRRREYYRKPVEDAMVLRWEQAGGLSARRGSEGL